MSVDPVDNIPRIADEIVEPEIEPVAPVSPAREVGEVVADGDDTEASLTSSDMVDISAQARQLSREARDAEPQPAEATDTAIVRLSEGTAVRELLETLANYDNAAAVRAYDRYLALFSRYGNADQLMREELAILRNEPTDEFAFRDLGIFTGDGASGEQRRAIAEAMDQWLAGQGVFKPEMIDFPSGLGFRISPRSEAAENARNASEVLATNEPARIAAYLREMAQLTPADFSIYDPTGLSALTLDQRRDFLASADALLSAAGLDVRAAEITYRFNADGTVDLVRRTDQGIQIVQSGRNAGSAGEARNTPSLSEIRQDERTNRSGQTDRGAQGVREAPTSPRIAEATQPDQSATAPQTAAPVQSRNTQDTGETREIQDARDMRNDRDRQNDPNDQVMQSIERALNTGIPSLEAAVATIRRYGAVISGGQ